MSKESSPASEVSIALNADFPTSITPKAPMPGEKIGFKLNKLEALGLVSFHENRRTKPSSNPSSATASSFNSWASISTYATSISSNPASNPAISGIGDYGRDPQINRQDMVGIKKDVVGIKKESPQPCREEDTNHTKGHSSMSMSLKLSSCHQTTTVRARRAGDEASESLPSESPRSDASSVVTETSLAERKSRMIDNAVLEVTRRIRAMFIQVRGGTDSSTSGVNGASGLSKGPHRKTTATVSENKKRKIDDRDACDSGDEDEDAQNNLQGMNPLDTKEANPGYACPYFKCNPAMYKSVRTCPGPGWPNVHRVK